ncbi:MAG: Spy/CpxP family protein refolding chaperone [Gammaproteobacteria bacterium]|nr:Spy/CpxP family protein refolding chaperone [Gammaproteobacteria bacterium]MCP5425614.1 Spy/CpxP family protein refolding chaperone [Gammaproteobacteria bacterium]MCP5458986.1 Spy/CpxP family protein refolding chaperone [Gammaproteobacteria bacterium]
MTSLLLVSPWANAESPVIAEQSGQSPKALSDQEIAGYRAGEGMGMALAAELNHYPGPRHVLDLADDLHLDPQQRDAAQRLFDEMRAQTQPLGNALITKEKELDQLFATQTVTDESLRRLTQEISALQGQLRYLHLHAHLRMRELLTAEQRQAYETLRGYAAPPEPSAHDAHHHQHGAAHP